MRHLLISLASLFCTVATQAQQHPPASDAQRWRAERKAANRKPLADSAINYYLMKEARASFMDIDVAGSSSAVNDSLEKNINKHLQDNNNPFSNRAAVLDPERALLGLALGMEPEDIAKDMLTQKSVDSTAIDPFGSFAKVGNDFFNEAKSQNGLLKVRMIWPGCLTAGKTFGEKNVEILLPPSDYMFLKVNGLSYAENLSFIRHHETWHAKDRAFGFFNLSTKEPLREGEKFLAILRSETFADLAALGDMIRLEGADPSIIGKVIAFRDSHPMDQMHLSSHVLEALESVVRQMGLDAFRKLDDTKAEKIYIAAVKRFSLTAETQRMAVGAVEVPYYNAYSVGFGSFDQEHPLNFIRRAIEDCETFGFEKQKAALSDLHKTIEKISENVFKLDANKALQLCTSIDIQHGLSNPSPTAEERARPFKILFEKSRSDLQAGIALRWAQMMMESFKPSKIPPMSAADLQRANMVRHWDASRDYLDRAYANTGYLSPRTILRGFEDVMEGYRDKIKADPQNASLYTLKMSLMQQALTNNLQKTNFVQLNASYGVAPKAFLKHIQAERKAAAGPRKNP